MTYNEILENLCEYDKRNPYCCSDDETIKEHYENVKKNDCYCDNCFYGRTKLALQCLEYYNMLYNQ